MDMIEEIKEKMKLNNLSTGELAKRMEGNTKTRKKDISEILNRRRKPGLQLLEEIAKAMDFRWEMMKPKREKALKDLLG